MDFRKTEIILDFVQIGRIMLDKTVSSRLEAFLENGLHYRRGMLVMNKYKTVKEVCDLTGLTRKHLYYFHHEGVVRAVGYANYSVEGYDGYKLYDDTAVEKLQQISLYYQLGLKRDEIKAIMLTPGYDSNAVLHTLLALEQEKKIHIERNIAALNYLMLVGTKNGVSGSLRGVSLDGLGRVLLEIRQRSETPSDSPSERNMEQFTEEFPVLIAHFAEVEESELGTPVGEAEIQKIFEMSHRHLGADAPAFLLGLFMSVLGEGTIAQSLLERLTPAHGRAVIAYMIEHPQLFHHNPHPQSGAEET